MRVTKAAVNNALVPIVTACDQAFLPGLRALLQSINCHCPHRAVYVLDCGIASEGKHDLNRLHPHIQCREIVALAGLPMPSVGSHATYARLLLGGLFQNHDRLLYLDADTIVLSDLSELDGFVFDPRSAIAACVEPYTPTFGSHNGVLDHLKLGMSPSAPYFNAGVMLIHVPRWNEAQVMNLAIGYLTRSDLRITLFDQEALNVALCGRWQPLDPEWNVSRYWLHETGGTNRPNILNDARIVHFLSSEKPWSDPERVSPWLLEKFLAYSSRVDINTNDR